MTLSEETSVMQIQSKSSVLVNKTNNAVTNPNSLSSAPMVRQMHQKKHEAGSVEVGGAYEY